MIDAREPTRAWQPVDPRRAGELVDARLQLHHAAQLVAAFGISYLPAQSDDSHTNMEWLAPLIALASKPAGIQSTRVAVQLHPFALLVLGADNALVGTFLLDGATLDGAARWLRAQFAGRGSDSARYTLDRHYEI